MASPAFTTDLVPLSGKHRLCHPSILAIAAPTVTVSSYPRRLHLMGPAIAASHASILRSNNREFIDMVIGTGRSQRGARREIPFGVASCSKVIGTGRSQRGAIREIPFGVASCSKVVLGTGGGNGGDPPVPPKVVAPPGDGGVPDLPPKHRNLQLLIKGGFLIAGLVVMHAKSDFAMKTLKAEAADKFKTFCYTQTYTLILQAIVYIIMYIFFR